MALLVDIEKKTGDFKLSVKFEIEKEYLIQLSSPFKIEDKQKVKS